MSCDALFAGAIRVINIGLEGFADDLAAAGIEVIHLDWRPPAGGNSKMASLLGSLDDD